MQPRAPGLARDAAAERPHRVSPAGQVSEPVQVMLHCFVTHQARHLGAERVTRGLEGPQPGDRVKADQAVTLMRDKPAQRGGQLRAQLRHRQVCGRQRGHLPMDLPG